MIGELACRTYTGFNQEKLDGSVLGSRKVCTKILGQERIILFKDQKQQVWLKVSGRGLSSFQHGQNESCKQISGELEKAFLEGLVSSDLCCIY